MKISIYRYSALEIVWSKILLLGFVVIVAWMLVTGCKKEQPTPLADDSGSGGPALAAVDGSTGKPGDESTPAPAGELVSPPSPLTDNSPSPSTGDAVRPADGESPIGVPAIGQAPAGDTEQPSTSDLTQSATGERSTPPTNEAPGDADPIPPSGPATLSITMVQIGQEAMTAGGRGTLPADSCIYTQLATEDVNVAWWPADICIELVGGRWEIVVPLSLNNRPVSLDEDEDYILRAWADVEPRLEAEPFAIELDGPGLPPPPTDDPPPADDDPPPTSEPPPPPPVIGSTPSPPGEEPPLATDTLRITTIQISPGLVVVGGRSTLPDTICIYTQLYADDEIVPWWPADSCAAFSDERWQIEIPLDTDDRPPALDESPAYILRAWAQVDPLIEAPPFFFDLAGPPDL